MSLYLKIILIIFGAAYLISPVDIIPDLLLPYIGWIDDSVIIGTLFYLIRYGKLPNFLFKKQDPFMRPSGPESPDSGSNKKEKKKRSHPHRENPPRPKPIDAYEILGISPQASKKEIQEAYKQAVKKYHPDKLSHLGEEFSNLANKKFLEIQNAYDTLMKK